MRLEFESSGLAPDSRNESLTRDTRGRLPGPHKGLPGLDEPTLPCQSATEPLVRVSKTRSHGECLSKPCLGSRMANSARRPRWRWPKWAFTPRLSPSRRILWRPLSRQVSPTLCPEWPRTSPSTSKANRPGHRLPKTSCRDRRTHVMVEVQLLPPDRKHRVETRRSARRPHTRDKRGRGQHGDD